MSMRVSQSLNQLSDGFPPASIASGNNTTSFSELYPGLSPSASSEPFDVADELVSVNDADTFVGCGRAVDGMAGKYPMLFITPDMPLVEEKEVPADPVEAKKQAENWQRPSVEALLPSWWSEVVAAVEECERRSHGRLSEIVAGGPNVSGNYLRNHLFPSTYNLCTYIFQSGLVYLVHRLGPFTYLCIRYLRRRDMPAKLPSEESHAALTALAREVSCADAVRGSDRPPKP